jgi:hypothetical protein
MVTTSLVVCGIYCDRHSTENAIESLRASGYRETDIRALFPDQVGTKKLLHMKQTRLLEGIALGAGLGALVSSVLEWSGETGELLTGVRPPLSTVLGLGAGSALGSLIGGLAGMRIPKTEEHYERRVRRGEVLLAVHCDSPELAKKAAIVLKRTNATDVSSRNDFAIDLVIPGRLTIRPALDTVATPTRTKSDADREVRKSAA